MSELETTQVRAPEVVTITVIRARNLRGQRGETVTSMVKVEFGDRVLGESPKEECATGQPAEFNHNVMFNVPYDDPQILDELATKPVILTLIEVLPKEKKQKEEKTMVLGQCSFDLIPLVQGELKHTSTLTVNAVPGSALETLTPEQAKPEIDVSASVEGPILTEKQQKEGNLLEVTIESLYSPPDVFSFVGQQYIYTSTLPLPLTQEKENTIVFAGGVLKPGQDKEAPNRQKKWALPGTAVGNTIYIQDRFLSNDAIEDEDGDFKTKEDREHRTTAEQDKNRVTWNIERRSFMDASGAKGFQDKIAKSRFWPIEIYRCPVPSAAKGKKEDENHISFHGIAYLNLAPLLYPGVQRIRGAYKVVAYSDQELLDKTGRKGALADDALKIANNILSRTGSSPFFKGGKPGKEDLKAKDTKKGASDAASEAEGGHLVNMEGHFYFEARSYIMIEISLQRPLVPKRQPEELARRVAEYIPSRPMFPKRTDGAERAVNEYHSQIANVASLILDEFRDSFGESLISGVAPNSSKAMEERRQKLIFQLNLSGKYFAFKEQLKNAVIKIVREKYLKTSNFKDKEELQSFLSELYVYLVDQMHVGLNKALAVEDESPIPKPPTESAQLKHFAKEAVVTKNFTLAAKYYQERIARDRNDPDNWVDYGTFCLFINDFTKAEECFKECVSIDQMHIKGLLLYGLVCSMQDKNEAAETFFEAATTFEPKNIVAWTLLGLYYNSLGNDIGTEMAFMEADKLNMAAAVQLLRTTKEQEQREQRERSRMLIANQAQTAADQSNAFPADGERPGSGAADLAQCRSPNKEDTPAEVQTTKTTPVTPSSITSSERKLKHTGSATKRKTEVVEPQNLTAAKPDKAGAMGGSMTQSETQMNQAKSSSEEPVEPQSSPLQELVAVPSTTIYMHTLDFLLDVKALPFAERALSHHLLHPLGGHSAVYYIAEARLELQKEQLDRAEGSLKEALANDHQAPDAWALMGHVKFLKGNLVEAKGCYERTIAFVTDAAEMHSIYLRLASIYLQEGQFQNARRQFLMACKQTPSSMSWLGVGIACYRLGELDEAEDALSEANILNNMDPDVWGYLTLVCLCTGRQVEAEQSYKYAIKLNLQEQELLDEIHRMQEEVGFGNPQM